MNAQTTPKQILSLQMWADNFAYVPNAELVPVAAHLEDGSFAIPSENRIKHGDTELAGLGDRKKFRYIVVPAIVGENTTSQPGNHGVRVETEGETILEWINRIQAVTGEIVIAITMREHSGYEEDDYAYWTEIVVPYDFEKLRRKVRDALNKTADNGAIIDCALRLAVKL